MRNILHPIVLGLIVLGLTALAPALPAREDGPLFVDRVDVNVVNIEVFVSDRRGRPVSGLGLEDFELFEDGQPVEISNFYTAARGDRLLEGFERDRALVSGGRGSGVDPAEGPESTRLPPPEDQRLHLVVYVDHFNLRPHDQTRVLGALADFVEHRLDQGDRVMLVSAKFGVEIVVPFTDRRQRLLDGIETLSKVGTHRQIDDVERRRTMRLMTDAANRDSLSEAHDLLVSYVERQTGELRRSAESLRTVARALAGLPGRKALLHVSSGLPQRPGESLYQHLSDLFGTRNLQDLSQLDGELVDPAIQALRQDQSHLYQGIIREANAHQVTFYALDARGSGAESTVSAEFTATGSNAPGGHATLDVLRAQNTQEPLVAMASATGGAAILNSFAFADALDDLGGDFDHFYSLGYRSPHGGDGRYHRFEVRVRRDGVKVRHRAGYVDKPAEDRVGDRTLSSLLLDLGENPLALTVETGRPEKDGRNRWLLPILVRLPIAKLTLLPEGALHRGRLRFYVVVRGSDGAVSALHQEPYPVEIPTDQLELALGSELGYTTRLRVQAGRPKLAIGVWDELAGTESFVQRQVEVGPAARRDGAR